jgi:ring-1,2-phenylacetyl-CoA epoxidase subunit PaaD
MDDTNTIWSLLESVNDPEIPVLSVVDLGIIRAVRLTDDGPEIVITPTYSGCPAMDMIRADIGAMLTRHGFGNASIVTVLSPAWTTDWMSEAGKEKLKAYGISPPSRTGPVACPQCRSVHTVLISEFGSTACKALYRCEDCREPFDHFKCH